MLGVAAAICAFSAAGAESPYEVDPETVLDSLAERHPRLILKDEALERLKKAYGDDKALRKCVADALHQADNAYRRPPLKYRKIGPRLLSVSRDCLDRTYALAFAWRWTGDAKYAEKAKENLLAVCAFPDWNPSHFLDTAEMSHAVVGKGGVLSLCLLSFAPRFLCVPLLSLRPLR